jgi:hypothetical protein
VGDEDRWTKLEEIVRRVVKEEIAVLGKKGSWTSLTADG